jgi:hypothetical protein
MGQKIRTFAAGASVLCALSAPVLAQAGGRELLPEWKAVLKGVDGVVVYCLTSRDPEYAVRICDRMSQAVTAAFDGSGLKVARTAGVYTGIDLGPEHNRDPSASKQAPGMASPLVIRLLIQGTAGASPGVATSITVSRPFRAAVEAGAARSGVAGDLVVREMHWVAQGPRRQTVAFSAEHGAKRVLELVTEIRTGL